MGPEPGERIRIAHVMGEFLRGGTERVVLDLLSRLDAGRFHVHVLCTTSEGLKDVRRGFEASGITTSLATAGLGDLSGRGWGLRTTSRKALSLLRLIREIRRGGFSIVHTHGLTNNLYGRLAAITAGVPLVITHDHNVHAFTRFDTFLWRLLNLKTALNLSVSSAVEKNRVGFVPSSRDKSKTLLNGIDLKTFRPPSETERREAKRRLGVDSHRRVVGTMGRLVPVKRVDLFLRACASAAGACPDARFLVVGDGELRSELELLSSELGIAHSVTFTGWTSRPEEALWAMDVFAILSGGREGFGLAAAEAMACGLPAIGVDSASSREVLSEDCAILVRPEANAVGTAMALLLADEGRAARIGAAASVSAAARFDITRAARQLESIYETAVCRLHDTPRRRYALAARDPNRVSPLSSGLHRRAANREGAGQRY